MAAGRPPGSLLSHLSKATIVGCAAAFVVALVVPLTVVLRLRTFGGATPTGTLLFANGTAGDECSSGHCSKAQWRAQCQWDVHHGFSLGTSTFSRELLRCADADSQGYPFELHTGMHSNGKILAAQIATRDAFLWLSLIHI